MFLIYVYKVFLSLESCDFITNNNNNKLGAACANNMKRLLTT
jgi:hypothetical protein